MSDKEKIQIVWFKRNLRVMDHSPFYHACAKTKHWGKVFCLYVHEEVKKHASDYSIIHHNFLLECLDSLKADLKSVGGDLFEFRGEPEQTLKKLSEEFDVSAVWAHQEISSNSEFARDKRVRHLLNGLEIPFFELEQDNTKRGGRQSVSFPDYFKNSCVEELKSPLGKDLSSRLVAFYQGQTSNRESIFTPSGIDAPERLKGGRLEAERLIRKFFTAGNVKKYPYSMSSPETVFESCSRLSPYLTYGVISDRQAMYEANQVVNLAHLNGSNKEEIEKIESAIRFWLDRLAWRQGYIQALESDTTVLFKDYVPELERSRILNQKLMDAWEEGQTGFPYIDACMRALKRTGYLNMRARGTVASFALMHIWQPWKVVSDAFAKKLTDYHHAIHVHQIRIHAGSFASSGVMIYDPIKQSKEQSPSGRFIRENVPELSSVPDGFIHEPWAMSKEQQKEFGCTIGKDYPSPIIETENLVSKAKARIDSTKNPKPHKGDTKGIGETLPLF